MAPSVLGVGNGVLFVPNSAGESGPIIKFYNNDNQTGTPTNFLQSSLTFVAGSFGNTTTIGSVTITDGPGTIYFYQYQEADSTKGHFGSSSSPTQGGNWLRVWDNPQRAINNIYAEIEWTAASEGGVWSPNPTFANRKQEGIVLPDGTWYLRVSNFGLASSGGTVFNTGATSIKK